MTNPQVRFPGYTVYELIDCGSRSLVYRQPSQTDSQPVRNKQFKWEQILKEANQFPSQYPVAKHLSYCGIVQSLNWVNHGHSLRRINSEN